MEQLEFDCRLESERELEENVNIALEFACKQVKETSKSKVSNRHDGYGIASEFYAGMKLDQKKVDESMKDFLRILPTEDDAKAVEAASSLKNAASEAITAGADVYWDNTNGVITATAESNILAGYAIADAAAADAVVSIKINA